MTMNLRSSLPPIEPIKLTIMKVTYDPEVDVLRLLFNESPIEESDEEREGVIFDYDINGKLVGMEILDAEATT